MRDVRSDRFTCASVVNENTFFRLVEAASVHALELEITLNAHPPDGGVLIPTGSVTVGALDSPSLIAFTERRKFGRDTIDPYHNRKDLRCGPGRLGGRFANGFFAWERRHRGGWWAAAETQDQHDDNYNPTKRRDTGPAHIRTVRRRGEKRHAA
jgi:hypothetical protein